HHLLQPNGKSANTSSARAQCRIHKCIIVCKTWRRSPRVSLSNEGLPHATMQSETRHVSRRSAVNLQPEPIAVRLPRTAAEKGRVVSVERCVEVFPGVRWWCRTNGLYIQCLQFTAVRQRSRACPNSHS